MDTDCTYIVLVSHFPSVMAGVPYYLLLYVFADEMMFTTAWYHRPADVLGSKSDENYNEVRIQTNQVFFPKLL